MKGIAGPLASNRLCAEDMAEEDMAMSKKTQLLLPKPQNARDRFVVPVPLYGDAARLCLPVDMTEAEARKIARVVLAYAKVTARNASPHHVPPSPYVR